MANSPFSDAERRVGRTELYAFASCEHALFFAEDFDSEEPDRIVFDAPPVGGVDCEHVGFAIDCLNATVAALGNLELFASAREADHIAFFIIVGHRALRAGDPAIYEDRVLLPDERDMAADDQLRPNRFVQLSAFVVCWADDENALS